MAKLSRGKPFHASMLAVHQKNLTGLVMIFITDNLNETSKLKKKHNNFVVSKESGSTKHLIYNKYHFSPKKHDEVVLYSFSFVNI